MDENHFSYITKLKGKKITPHFSLPINVMEWSRHCPLCWVQQGAHPNKVLKLALYNKLTFHLTQHNSIIGKASTIPQQIKKT
jgi:hypothetical protein